VTASAIIGIISAVLAIARFFVDYAQQQKWLDAGAAAATLKGIQDADAAIKSANEARASARDIATRDPASILREDDGFKRPD
jgi:hypothetical protein